MGLQLWPLTDATTVLSPGVAIGGVDLDPRGVHADPIEPGVAQRHILQMEIGVRTPHRNFPARVATSAPAPQPSRPRNARCGFTRDLESAPIPVDARQRAGK